MVAVVVTAPNDASNEVSQQEEASALAWNAFTNFIALRDHSILRLTSFVSLFAYAVPITRTTPWSQEY